MDEDREMAFEIFNFACTQKSCLVANLPDEVQNTIRAALQANQWQSMEEMENRLRKIADILIGSVRQENSAHAIGECLFLLNEILKDLPPKPTGEG